VLYTTHVFFSPPKDRRRLISISDFQLGVYWNMKNVLISLDVLSINYEITIRDDSSFHVTSSLKMAVI
jgi:hypothetical protein